MNGMNEQLERVITRVLDGEARDDDRRVLHEAMKSPAARALFDEYAALDCEAGRVLRRVLGAGTLARAALGVRLSRPRVRSRGWRWPRAAATLALAAGLTGLFWFSPGPGASRAQQAVVSWFAPSSAALDLVDTRNPTVDRPSIRLSNTEREWLVMPGKNPGEFLVIEVDRTNSEQIPIHQDY